METYIYVGILNHKVCLDPYPIPNFEFAIHALVVMNGFTKIDLKMAYHQIPLYDNFKEVTMINTPVGLLKWRWMPYGNIPPPKKKNQQVLYFEGPLTYHPQSNGLTERMVQTVKIGLKPCSQQKEKIEVFQLRLLLSYYTIPHARRLDSPSALMGRQIRAPPMMSYSTNKKCGTNRTKNQIQKRQNLSSKKTAIQL